MERAKVTFSPGRKLFIFDSRKNVRNLYIFFIYNIHKCKSIYYTFFRLLFLELLYSVIFPYGIAKLNNPLLNTYCTYDWVKSPHWKIIFILLFV